MATMGALWSSCTSSVSPFFRTNFVYLMSGMGMLTLLAAACAEAFAGVFAAGFCWALRPRVLTLISIASNTAAIVCIDLLLKGCLHIEDRKTCADNTTWPARFRIAKLKLEKQCPATLASSL